MDPASRQQANYKAKQLYNVVADKANIVMTKIQGTDSQELDIAILKATLQDEVVPKEKHVRTLKVACSASAPRAQVEYVIHGLAKRLNSNSGWLVTLKTLMVFHRLVREIDQTFQEQVLKYGDRTGVHHLIRLDTYADHTTKETWDYSAWIRVYSLYLDERLDVFRTVKFDPEQDPAQNGHESKLKTCPTEELLEKLPRVQKLLMRMIACLPEGSAANNNVVQESCRWVVKESGVIYKVVCEGIMNLADKFFEMERTAALSALELYRENVMLNDRLNTFFAAVQQNPLLKGTVNVPNLQGLPADFITTMEDYVREAPRSLDASTTVSRRQGAAVPVVARSSSAIVARGGTMSAAFAGGSVNAVKEFAPPLPKPAGAKSPEPEAPKPAPPPEVDLLSFDALMVSEPAPPPPPPGPVDELDFLAQALGTGAAMPAAPVAPEGPSPVPSGFDNNSFSPAPPMAGAPAQDFYIAANGSAPGMATYGSNPYYSAPVQPPAPLGFGDSAFPPAQAVSFAAPVGAPALAPAAAPGSLSSFNNPFLAPLPANTANFQAKKLNSDPLNALTSDLFAPKVAPVVPTAGQPMKEMKSRPPSFRQVP